LEFNKENKSYFLTCDVVYQMSLEFYKQFQESRLMYKELTKGGGWNFAGHSEGENNFYLNCSQTKHRTAISAIVFQALAVEAYVNLYGAIKMGEKKYYSEIETGKKGISTAVKITMIYKQSLHKSFPVNEKVYLDLKDLFEKRNKLVHYKPIGLDDSNSTIEEFGVNLFNQVLFIYKNIDSQMTVYYRLKKLLAELDGTQKDVVAEQESLLDYRDEYLRNEILKDILR